MKDIFYLWVDTETIGLNEKANGENQFNPVLEIACILTDSGLKELGYCHSFVKVKGESAETLAKKEGFFQGHLDSGLLQEWEIAKKKSPAQIERAILNLISRNCCGKVLLAGNSVSFDKEVIRRFFPKLFERLHYRILDVSSVREFIAALDYDLSQKGLLDKEYQHKALSDIEESIQEYKLYKDSLQASLRSSKISK